MTLLSLAPFYSGKNAKDSMINVSPNYHEQNDTLIKHELQWHSCHNVYCQLYCISKTRVFVNTLELDFSDTSQTHTVTWPQPSLCKLFCLFFLLVVCPPFEVVKAQEGHHHAHSLAGGGEDHIQEELAALPPHLQLAWRATCWHRQPGGVGGVSKEWRYHGYYG